MPGMLGNLTNMVRDWFIQDKLFVGPGVSAAPGDPAGSIYAAGNITAGGVAPGSIVGTFTQAPGTGAIALAANTTAVSNTAVNITGFPYPFDTYMTLQFKWLWQFTGTPPAGGLASTQFNVNGAATEIQRFPPNASQGSSANYTVTSNQRTVLVPAGSIPNVNTTLSQAAAGEITSSSANNDTRYWSVSGFVTAVNGTQGVATTLPAGQNATVNNLIITGAPAVATMNTSFVSAGACHYYSMGNLVFVNAWGTLTATALVANTTNNLWTGLPLGANVPATQFLWAPGGAPTENNVVQISGGNLSVVAGATDATARTFAVSTWYSTV